MDFDLVVAREYWAAIAFAAALVILLIVWLLREPQDARMFRGRCICPRCGSIGIPKLVVPGSHLTHFLLIFCFVIPAVFYGLLREVFSKFVCPICGQSGMIPPETPRGADLMKRYHPGAEAR
jgi:predicted RNA-binding Zn-ribbon protein involved in translation (DUF1610 family)